jgi:hypothetical protein
MRRARVRGSGWATSWPSNDPEPEKDEPRRSRVCDRVVSEGATGALGASALARRTVFSAFSELGRIGSKPVVWGRGGSCGGV